MLGRTNWARSVVAICLAFAFSVPSIAAAAAPLTSAPMACCKTKRTCCCRSSSSKPTLVGRTCGAGCGSLTLAGVSAVAVFSAHGATGFALAASGHVIDGEPQALTLGFTTRLHQRPPPNTPAA